MACCSRSDKTPIKSVYMAMAWLESPDARRASARKEALSTSIAVRPCCRIGPKRLEAAALAWYWQPD